jgi:hypothetical protein
MPNIWFRMYNDFLEDPKLISLAFEDQRHFIGILALKSSGTIDHDCAPKLLDRIVAQKLWIDYAIIGDVKKRLVDAGLISENWQPLAWEKRQFLSDTSKNRVRKFREKQKLIERNVSCNVTGNVTVTTDGRYCNAIDTDTDTDTKKRDSQNAADAAASSSDEAVPKTEQYQKRNSTNLVTLNLPERTEEIRTADAAKSQNNCPVTELVAMYREIFPDKRQPLVMNEKRRKIITQGWKKASDAVSVKTGKRPYTDTESGLEFWRNAMTYARANAHFCMKKQSNFSIDWLFSSNNIFKIVEDNYSELYEAPAGIR